MNWQVGPQTPLEHLIATKSLDLGRVLPGPREDRTSPTALKYPRIKRWISSDSSDIMTILEQWSCPLDSSFKYNNRRYSAVKEDEWKISIGSPKRNSILSQVCATILLSNSTYDSCPTLKEWAKGRIPWRRGRTMLSIQHLCALYTDASDPLSGPKGLMRSLLGQVLWEVDHNPRLGFQQALAWNSSLVQEVVEGDAIFWEKKRFGKGKERKGEENDGSKNSVAMLCEAFRYVLSSFPRYMTIFLAVDGIHAYDLPGMKGDVEAILDCLYGLAGRDREVTRRRESTNAAERGREREREAELRLEKRERDLFCGGGGGGEGNGEERAGDGPILKIMITSPTSRLRYMDLTNGGEEDDGIVYLRRGMLGPDMALHATMPEIPGRAYGLNERARVWGDGYD